MTQYMDGAVAMLLLLALPLGTVTAQSPLSQCEAQTTHNCTMTYNGTCWMYISLNSSVDLSYAVWLQTGDADIILMPSLSPPGSADSRAVQDNSETYFTEYTDRNQYPTCSARTFYSDRYPMVTSIVYCRAATCSVRMGMRTVVREAGNDNSGKAAADRDGGSSGTSWTTPVGACVGILIVAGVVGIVLRRAARCSSGTAEPRQAPREPVQQHQVVWGARPVTHEMAPTLIDAQHSLIFRETVPAYRPDGFEQPDPYSQPLVGNAAPAPYQSNIT
jgi:hypothetical protein